MLTELATRRAIARGVADAVLLMVALTACRRESAPTKAPGENGQQAIPSPSLPALYREGTYGVNNGNCALTPPRASEPRVFQCGVLLMELRPGFTAESVADLVTALSASVIHTRTEGTTTSIRLSVPKGTERAAILRAFADERVNFAELNWGRSLSR